MPWWIRGGDCRARRVVKCEAWLTGSMIQDLNVEGRRRLAVWQIQWLGSMLFQGQIFREDSSSVSTRKNVSHYFRSDRIHSKAFNPFCAGSMLIITESHTEGPLIVFDRPWPCWVEEVNWGGREVRKWGQWQLSCPGSVLLMNSSSGTPRRRWAEAGPPSNRLH